MSVKKKEPDFICPVCNGTQIQVRSKSKGGLIFQPIITRKRYCSECNTKFETHEVLMITPSQQSSASREVRAIQAHASDLRRLAESNASIDTEQYKLSAALAHALRGEMRHQRAISGIRGGGGHNAVHGAGQLSGLQLFSLGALEYYYEPLVPLIRTYKELSRNFTAVLEGDEIDTPALRASQPYFMMLYTQLTPADQMVDTSQPLNNSAIEYLDL